MMFKDIAESFFSKEKISSFEESLGEENIEEFLRKSFVQGAVLLLIGIGAAALLGLGVLYITIIALVLLFLPLAINYFVATWVFESNKRKKELLVPDLLLQASIFPKGTSMNRIIRYMGEQDYGLLSNEFRKAETEMRKGASVEEALSGIKNRSKSRVIERAVNLLVQGYKSGADMGPIFKETAEDILETNQILRERVSTLVVEKYTLIFAGGIIVPVVLGLLSGMVSGMNFSVIESLELGMNSAQRKEIFEAALLGTQIYILEYAAIASFFIATQEGNSKKAVIYAAFLIPASLIAYTLAKGI